MSCTSIKIAIVSDLHCHPNINGVTPSTYLLTDKLRSPAKDHPVESLISLIKSLDLEVDLTLCPGDFTDKANLQGLISGWDFSLEINKELGSDKIIATIGNHDVDVYKNHSNYSYQNIRGLKKGFPFSNDSKDLDTFWSKGCVIIEEQEYRVLVINSSYLHYDSENKNKGMISPESLDYIENYLIANNDNKIQIAMSHHPPIEHPRKHLGEDDKIQNGDELLDLLGKYKFDLFIYGHKHDPFIKYYNTTAENYRIPLFSSGSFSANTNLMFTSLRNTFHIIELFKENSNCKGKILTWTYLPHEGWIKNFDESAFAPCSGFGNLSDIPNIYNAICQLLKDKNKMSWEDISNQINDINHLIPSDSLNLYHMLIENKIKPDQHIWNYPQEIYNLKNI